MKKLTITLLFALAALTFGSCEDTFQECNCGTILSDRVSDYSVVIRSECSGNEKRFTLQPGDWINAHVGTRYCITNSTGW